MGQDSQWLGVSSKLDTCAAAEVDCCGARLSVVSSKFKTRHLWALSGSQWLAVSSKLDTCAAAEVHGLLWGNWLGASSKLDTCAAAEVHGLLWGNALSRERYPW